MQQDAIRVVGEDEWDRAFDIQADAFSEDPILGHWLVGGRDQADRARRFRRFMGAYAVGASFRDHAEIHMTADGAASAVWLRPPGHFGQPVAEQLRMLPVILALFGRRTNPRNIGLYERHGFRVTRVLDLPGGAPTATAMWRA